MKLSDKAGTTVHHVLVYGDPKTGKTELAGKLAEEFTIWHLDFENGFSTLKKLPIPWQERVNVFSIPDTKEFPIGIQILNKILSGNPLEICHAHGKDNCQICAKSAPTEKSRIALNEFTAKDILVIDSLSQISNSIMAFMTKDEKDPITYKPEWADYRKQGQWLDAILGKIQHSKCNIICIAHTVEAQMEDGTQKLVPYVGTREFSRVAAKYFDDVVFTHIMNASHRAGSGTTYMAKVQTGSRVGVKTEDDTKNASLMKLMKSSFVAEKTPGSIAVQNLSNVKVG